MAKLKPLVRGGGVYPTEAITPLVRGNGLMKGRTDNDGEKDQSQETPQTATEAATIEESKGT